MELATPKETLNKLEDIEGVVAASLAPYQTEDEQDVERAHMRLAQIKANHKCLVKGKRLESRLAKLGTSE